MKIFPLALVVTLCTSVMGEDTMILKSGDTAPDFSLESTDGNTISLKEFAGDKYVVLIFYPGDETPVCTQQMCEIRDDYSSFEARNAVVFGINPAGRKSHEKFAKKNNLQFPLLMDEGNRTGERYGVKGLIMNKRTVYVIDKDGKIIYAKRGKPAVSEILASIPDNK